MTRSPAPPLPPPKARRRLRETAALTQAQLATRVGVTPGTVRAWESGRTTPRGRKREAYAKLLKTLADEETARQTAQTPRPEPDSAPAPNTAQNTAPEPTAKPQPEPVPEARPAPVALTPAQAFDALYEFGAPALVRQTFLLTGRREQARESVERAFQTAWEHWPEVARDRDPVGWVRATAYEYALSPWQRLRPRHRHPEPPPADPGDRTLLNTLLRLPPRHRRTLVLYDGVGLDLPETAAETEASTPAAANRLLRAREAVAGRLPALADPQVLHRRLAELASNERLGVARPHAVRGGGERRARFWTRAAIAFTAALIGTTALTVHTAPTHYEPPVSPGQAVRGVPPRVAQGSLSDEELELRQKLRDQLQDGPERLSPRLE
ncbi:sigma factor-like helix-turn-helix DNA-binding protein [Streptomyces coelicoflavus]|uniref:sigma factor-like helix-turn-helix DNA-binding protein n=1 Tax=Streptomyces coelicoflavus TaxID=285562 RepID=UPI002E258969|nr:sigma factor-like helix-turn-helix DNA-binding protein [Streptomyces coelicoflavus]